MEQKKKKPKKGWEFFCNHANEVPNICPCSSECVCKYYSCKDKPYDISKSNR